MTITRLLRLELGSTLSGSFVTVRSVKYFSRTSPNLMALHLDNERGSLYIHETTPYASRDDVEVAAKECKTHRAASETHKTFQVCNRKLNSRRGGVR
jgi:hypothetical protein